jgi:type IV pilus assembly protein PilC
MASDKGSGVKENIYAWEGKDKTGKLVRGEMRAGGETLVRTTLRRQGVLVTKIKQQKLGKIGSVTDKDITLFTRQLATMMKAGVPMLQAFDIVGKGASNAAVGKLLMDIRTDVETGSSLTSAFRKYPLYFDALFCNLVGAGEQAGILDSLLDRLATYKEKIQAIKSKIKSALFYPVSIIVVAFVIVAVIMIFVIPAFKEVFANFGAELPLPTMVLIQISDFFVEYWYLVFGIIGGSVYGFFESWKRSKPMQIAMDRTAAPDYPCLAPWYARRPSLAGPARCPPCLPQVCRSSKRWTQSPALPEITSITLLRWDIKAEISTGQNLTVAMQNTNLFPSMVIQMVSIGEESGQLDAMLSKVSDFFEAEVDDAVEALSSLMEPMIMVVLGSLIGGMVVAMYLPIFKLGAVV